VKAIILAAGRGSRMGGMTAERPKCLTQLAGKPLLDWQIEALRDAGAESIAVVKGYLAETISRPDLESFINPRWSETNMVGSLACAREWLTRHTCLVSYSDIVYRPDIPLALAGAAGDIAITYDTDWLSLWRERFENPLSDAETFATDANGRLVEIGSRAQSLDQIKGQYMGLLRFTPRGWQEVEEELARLEPSARDRLDMTALLRRLLASGATIDTVPISGGWYEVDTASDLAIYEARAQAHGGRLWPS
jgi:choline kinase